MLSMLQYQYVYIPKERINIITTVTLAKLIIAIVYSLQVGPTIRLHYNIILLVVSVTGSMQTYIFHCTNLSQYFSWYGIFLIACT